MIHVVHHDGYVVPAPARSAYRWNKNGLIRDLLRDESASIAWHAPEAMPRCWLEAVHDADYVAEVMAAAVPPAKERRIGFPVTEAVARRAQLVLGGTWLAACLALEHGFAANTAGGSHHALADTGAGYCIFNDLVIAAHRLIAERKAARISIVDLDVHQGDGTAALARDRDDIMTFSMHAAKNFPARKQLSDIDVALPDGTGDDAYIEVLASHLANMLDAGQPDLILYQAGVDPHRDDRLGRLGLSDAGLAARDHLVMAEARARGIPLASTVGGGYGEDALEIAQRHVATILTLGRSSIATDGG